MTLNKCWGKKFEDKTDPKAYQDELLKRYEIYMDLDWVASWDVELNDMNFGKRGKPYAYPKSMIDFQALFVEKFSTRSAEAITRKLEGYGLTHKCNDYAIIHRRIIGMDLNFSIPKGIEIHEGMGGSGFKMTNFGEYFQSKYGKIILMQMHHLQLKTIRYITDINHILKSIKKRILSEIIRLRQHHCMIMMWIWHAMMK